VVESRDPAVWAAAIADIVANPETARHLSVAARKRAEHFSWERSAKSLLEVYRGLLQADSPADAGETPPPADAGVAGDRHVAAADVAGDAGTSTGSKLRS